MYVKVRVIPKAKKENVKKINNSTFEIIVKEPAERNLANTRIKKLLALEYQVEVSCVRLITGYHSGSKIFNISNINLPES